VEFRVLGPLEVLGDDGPLPLGGAKQRALLALLVLNANRVVSRERMIDELWQDDPPETAVTTVQVYVSRLRKLLGTNVLVTRAPGYVFHTAQVVLDLEQFERLRAAGRPEKALALWRGPPLAEFGEPFARAEAARLEDLRLATLEDRIAADLERGCHADVVGEVEELVREHPHRERLRAQLMLALYRSGRQAEALAAYRDARAALDELGLEPSEELRRLERSILTQDAALTSPPAVLSATLVLPSPLALRPAYPFVGRARELSLLGSLLQFAGEGERQVALLAGEAGSGKSRVLRELAHDAAKHGVLVLYGSCDPIVDAPYQPFLEALEFLMELSDRRALAKVLGRGRGELARLLPVLGDPPAEAVGNAEVARRVLHSAVRALVTHVSRERPLVLMLDDMHWADGPSLELLRDLAQSTSQIRLFLLATYRDRSEDLRPEFSDALAALARVDGIAHLRLGGLSGEEVAEFVRSSSGVAGSEVATAIHELTEGTPFFLCELWRELLETDAVEKAGGVLQLARPLGALATPRGVRDVTRYRLSRLAPVTREMLELAAVIGPTFELTVLERAGGSSGVASSLEEALATGTIEELPGPALACRFSHELLRRALYDRLSGLRRAQLHLRVGDALEHVHGEALDRILPELARHFTIAASVGGRERAIEYNVRAAVAAVSVFAMAEAEIFAVAALDHAGEDTVAWARAKYVLATAGYRQGKRGAEAHGEAAAAAFAAHGDPDAAAAAEIVVFRALLNQRQGDEAEAALDRALALVHDRPPSAAKASALASHSTMLTLSRARFPEALESAREALELAEHLGLVSLQIAALSRIGNALGNLGTGGIAELERAVELSRGGADPDETRIAYINLAARLFGDGRVRDSCHVSAEGLAEAVRYGLVDAGQ
jgi:DNA-binding SARP family transcriptional activator